MTDEIWKDALGWEGLYEVSSMGNIRSIARMNPVNKVLLGGKTLKKILGSRGYYVVNLTAKNRRNQYFVHKLVLEAFVGKAPANMEACHNDGDRLNCSLSNLRWDTRSNNHKDKIKHGTHQIGEKANNVKLSNEVVVAIRKAKLTSGQAVKMYGLSRTNAKRIVNYKTWRHLVV
jgi:hypothetical protein